MRRIGLLLCALGLTTACPGPKAAPDGGTDAGGNPPIITVSGRAFIHPQAVAWASDAGLPVPSLAGLTLAIDEPLKVALGDPSGHFGQVTLDGDGGFSVPNVDTGVIALGLAATFSDQEPGVCSDGGLGGPDAGCGTPKVVHGASGVYDMALENGVPPSMDLSGTKAYALPTPFHDQLTAAVGINRITSITSGAATTLLGAGFIFGEVVDANGHPVSGVTVAPKPNTFSSQFFYLSDDWQTVNTTATGATGIFLFVHNANGVATFTFTVNGHPEYLNRNAGSAPGNALIMTVYPGTTPP